MTKYRAVYDGEHTSWYELDTDWIEYSDWQDFVAEIMCELGFSFYNVMSDYFSYGKDTGREGRMSDFLHVLNDDEYDELCVSFMIHVVINETDGKEFYGLTIETSDDEEDEEED